MTFAEVFWIYCELLVFSGTNGVWAPKSTLDSLESLELVGGFSTLVLPERAQPRRLSGKLNRGGKKTGRNDICVATRMTA